MEPQRSTSLPRLGLGLLTLGFVTNIAGAQDLQNGDVVIGHNDGVLRVYDNDGNLIQELLDEFGFITSILYDLPTNQLLANNFSQAKVVAFDGDAPNDVLQTIELFPLGGAGSESVVVDLSGNRYVGNQNGDHEIKKFAADGTFLDSFDVAVEVAGTCHLALSTDQRTMFYTSTSDTIFRYDLVDRTQLPPFSTASPETLHGLELLPPYDGSGGLLACGTSAVRRFDAGGNIVQFYGPAEVGPWYGVSLDSDGTSFWATSPIFGLFRFDLETGDLLLGPVPDSHNAYGVEAIQRPECFLVLGSGRGGEVFETGGHSWETQIAGIQQHYPTTMVDLPAFEIPVPDRVRKKMRREQTPKRKAFRHIPDRVGEFTVQVLMWNPHDFPQNPEQWTPGLEVTLWSDGSASACSYGERDGMEIGIESFREGGRRYVRFPFTIDGF